MPSAIPHARPFCCRAQYASARRERPRSMEITTDGLAKSLRPVGRARGYATTRESANTHQGQQQRLCWIDVDRTPRGPAIARYQDEAAAGDDCPRLATGGLS